MTIALGAAALAAPAAAEASHLGPAEPSTAQQAKEAVTRARAAARRGEWEAALDGFQAAMRLRPSAKLHYNIGVCHHRMALAAPTGSPAREQATAAAIDAYNRYLQEAPKSKDTDGVRATVIELGGTPPGDGPEVLRVDGGGDAPELDTRGYADLWDAPVEAEQEPDPQDPAPPPATEQTPILAPDPPPEPGPEPTSQKLPRVRLGAALVSATVNPVDSGRSAEVDVPFSFGVSAGVSILLTKSRNLGLGLEFTLVGGLPFQREKYGLWHGSLSVVADYRLVFGRSRRVALLLGGLVGGGGQTLRTRGTPSLELACPLNANGEVSKRGGLLVGGRAGVAALLGKKRNHAIVLRVTPSLLAMGRGEASQGCREQDPFRELNMSSGAGFAFFSDLGYAVGF